VVDDNKDLLTTFSMILKRRGFYVDTASDGVSAVDKFKEHDYDITLMDIVMPEMNGVEAFRKIREISPEATVILMTAYSEEEMIQAAKTEGAHSVIHKPIRIDQLIEILKKASDNQTILIVDDDEDICRTLAKALELKGYPVFSAGSGQQAIDIAQQTNCQIAFIDVKLPDIDGLETFLRLKEINPEILTVMMTGFRNEVKDALDKAREASAITCLYKPFAPTEVADLIKQIGKKFSAPVN
jgi:two-component system chemotaxis response regulator CheY